MTGYDLLCLSHLVAISGALGVIAAVVLLIDKAITSPLSTERVRDIQQLALLVAGALALFWLSGGAHSRFLGCPGDLWRGGAKAAGGAQLLVAGFIC